eukprot:gene39330-53171_t
MNVSLAAFLYLVSGVLFIMALRGLSHPSTSRRGNIFGMVGMAIAILTTLALAKPSVAGLGLIVLGIAIGGGLGAVIARRIAMTSMPQLVAGFHSLVGLAAVLVASAALYAPSSFGIGDVGSIHGQALVEMSLGVAIGAITFTGSIIAFLKLDGRMSGKPIMLPMRHALNIAIFAGIVVLIGVLVVTESHLVFWLIVFGRKAVFLDDLLVAPACGAIELGDHHAPVFQRRLVDAVLVGVQLQQAAVRLQPGAVQGMQHGLGVQVGPSIPGWRRGAASLDRRLAGCGAAPGEESQQCIHPLGIALDLVVQLGGLYLHHLFQVG